MTSHSRMAIIKTMVTLDQDVEQLEPSYSASRNE